MSPAHQYLIDDLSVSESWRLFRIMAEIVDGFEELGDIEVLGLLRASRTDPLLGTGGLDGPSPGATDRGTGRTGSTTTPGGPCPAGAPGLVCHAF